MEQYKSAASPALPLYQRQGVIFSFLLIVIIFRKGIGRQYR